MAVNTLVGFERFYIELAGLFGNRWVWLAVILFSLFQLAFTYWPPMQKLFSTVAIDLHTWAMIVAVSSSVFILGGS